MNIYLKDWIGQATTGHGVMILLPTLLAMTTGELSVTAGVPLLIAAVVGLLWPENTTLKGAVQAVATDVETVISAYRAGVHQATLSTPADPQSRPPGPAVAGMVVLAMAALALSACAGQTDAQRAAEVQAVTDGMLCLAQASEAVAPLVTSDDANTVKAAHAAAAAENVLVSDRACQAAMQGAMTP